MPVFECRGCPQCPPCTLFILDEDCEEPTRCPWAGDKGEYVPVWRRLEVVD